jgi:phenylalanyl-tRNA synthetase alpha subunit
MSNRSEYEHRKKLNRIREDANKRVKEVRDHFVKIDKIRTQALGKTEEIRLSAQKDITRLEEEIKISALTEDTKKALSADIASLKKEIEDRAAELRSRLTAISIPP